MEKGKGDTPKACGKRNKGKEKEERKKEKKESEAKIMQEKEISILKQLSIPSPY